MRFILICYDIEAAGDWSWVKILTASSQDCCGPTANQPSKIQSAASLNMRAASHRQAASQRRDASHSLSPEHCLLYGLVLC